MRKVFGLVAVAAVVALCSAPAMAAPQGETGNGAPSGSHYSLNIIGHTNCPGDDLKGSNRHVIAVLLNGGDAVGDIVGKHPSTISKVNKIYLKEGDFQVLDGNACDGDGAKFQLPANPCDDGDTTDGICTDPGANNDNFTEYLVYVRALGAPGGSAIITTCATDEGPDFTFGTDDDVIVCSSENVVLVRSTGPSKFTNYTKELTTLVVTIDIDDDGDTELVRVELFNPELEDYFWNYDNNGLRLAQLRFYPIE